MKILAFLQNQWFNNPERIRGLFAESPQHRNAYIRNFLFMGCMTGKRLEKALGESLCQEIIWDEVSPEIGGHSSSVFPADLEHMERAIVLHRPEIILAFGKLAIDALNSDVLCDIGGRIGQEIKIFTAPHPTSRNNPLPQLMKLGSELRAYIGS